MQRIYDAWKAYAIFIVEVLSAYSSRTDHLPLLVSMGGVLVPLVAADYFLPRWASLSLFAAIGLPLAWFLATMIWVFFTQCSRQSGR